MRHDLSLGPFLHEKEEPSSYQYSFTLADTCLGFTKIPQGDC